MARLNHPGIVTVFDSGEDDEGPFIVMELIEGETVADRLASSGPFSASETAAIIGGAATALDEAHRQGVIHCDIKPSNLILGSSGRVRLTDFGIARTVDDVTRVTKTGELVGTLSYLAPEIAAGQRPTPASDIYALAAVAYEMLTGRPPFAAENAPALLAKISTEAPPDLDVQAPPGLASGVMAALSKDPSARPETAQRLALAMRGEPTLRMERDAASSGPAAQRERSGADEPTLVLATSSAARASRWRTVVPVIVVLVALAALVLAMLPRRNEAVGAPPVTSTSTTTSTPTTSTTTSTTTTTTLPATTAEPLATADQILAAIAAVIEGMDPPEFKPKVVRQLEKRFEEVAERADEDDRDRLADSLQKALEEILDLPESSVRSELLDLVVRLAESYGFAVDEDEIEADD